MPVDRRVGPPGRLARRAFGNVNQSVVGAAGIVAYPFWKPARAVFVLSTGRTGTDTLHRLLALSPELISLHEPRPRLMAERKAAFQDPEGTRAANVRRFKAARGMRLSSARRQDKTYVETSARMTFLAPVISTLLPNAQFIFMHRHPGAVVRSGMRRGWYKDHPADEHRITPGTGDCQSLDWGRFDAFEKVCWYWKAYVRFSIDFLEQLPANRWLNLPSDELFNANPEDTERLFDFLGVSAPDMTSVRKILALKSNSQSKGDFPRFKDWNQSQIETLLKHASEEMNVLGYESEHREQRIAG